MSGRTVSRLAGSVGRVRVDAPGHGAVEAIRSGPILAGVGRSRLVSKDATLSQYGAQYGIPVVW